MLFWLMQFEISGFVQAKWGPFKDVLFIKGGHVGFIDLSSSVSKILSFVTPLSKTINIVVVTIDYM